MVATYYPIALTEYVDQHIHILDLAFHLRPVINHTGQEFLTIVFPRRRLWEKP